LIYSSIFIVIQTNANKKKRIHRILSKSLLGYKEPIAALKAKPQPTRKEREMVMAMDGCMDLGGWNFDAARFKKQKIMK
jgi:hypothetical protein